MKQFENKTIGELRKLTADWDRIQPELDKIKYPNKAKQEQEPSAQEIIDGVRE